LINLQPAYPMVIGAMTLVLAISGLALLIKPRRADV